MAFRRTVSVGGSDLDGRRGDREFNAFGCRTVGVGTTSDAEVIDIYQLVFRPLCYKPGLHAVLHCMQNSPSPAYLGIQCRMAYCYPIIIFKRN